MAQIGEHVGFNGLAQEDLNAHEYFAFAEVDGKVANNAREASGVIMNKPKNGEGVDCAVQGRLPFRAGAAIASDAKVTVTTSGYFTTCTSGSHWVGKSLAAVTSGSIGYGLFNFATPVFAANSNFIA